MRVSLICQRKTYVLIVTERIEHNLGIDRFRFIAPPRVSSLYSTFVKALRKIGYEILYDSLDCDVAVVFTDEFDTERLKEYKNRGIPIVAFYAYTPLLSYVCFREFDRQVWDEKKQKLECLLHACDTLLIGSYTQIGDLQQIFHDIDTFVDFRNIRLIHQFCDEDIFRPDTECNHAMRKKHAIREDDIVFMYHGSFHPVLGLEHFIAGTLASSNRKIKFVLIGTKKMFREETVLPYCEKGLRKNLMKMTENDERFIYLDWNHPPVNARYLNMSDFYVSHLSNNIKVQHFSRLGTFQAIGCGLPVVCANTIGAHYFIRDRFNGIIMPPYSAEAVTEFLNGVNREYAAELKNNMHEVIKNEQWYFFKANSQTIKNVFEGALSRKK